MDASDRLVQQLHLTATQAAIVHDPSNMFFLTGGFSGEGLVCITGARRYIVTDFRYATQAQREAPGFEVVTIPQGGSYDRWVADMCRRCDVEVVFYEEDHLTVQGFARLRAMMTDEVAFVQLDKTIDRLRRIKEEPSLNCIRRACQITVRAFEVVLPCIREGMRERDIAWSLIERLRHFGADGLAFEPIVVTGENGAFCHGQPGDRKIRQGDLVTLDFGARVNGYCADMTRTVSLGEPKAELRCAYATVLRALDACEEALAPGLPCQAADSLARRMIEDAGYAGRFGHDLGHGLGLDVHELPHLAPWSKDTLHEGDVITVEPGIYLPGLGGVRLEDTVLITPGGHEVLTTAPRELIIL